LPDALPLKLALFRPIFKENRLAVKIVPFRDDAEAAKLLSDSQVEALVCDLPSGIVLSQTDAKPLILKNMLRANPFRPLFAIVGGPDQGIKDLAQLEGEAIAVPKGVSFAFYYEFLLNRSGVTSMPTVREVTDLSAAWNLLNKGEVAAAVLRTPYTDLAMKRQMPLLADDRTLPWMSVLVARKDVIEKKSAEIKKFIFAMEQAVLALNLKPDEFAQLLKDQGGIPIEARKDFPMPIFEGANAPAQDELEPVYQWLVQAGLLERHPAYESVVETRFLPDPKDVGLAFCCR
jgi:ABC-type nitrate/sulfonate/bicarbonate transport system substrate-binding protein